MLNEEIAGLVGGLRSSSNSSLSAFRRMEAKVEELEAEAEAAGQLGVSFIACPRYVALSCANAWHLGATLSLAEAHEIADSMAVCIG